MPDTAAGKPDGHDLLRLILAKVERFEDVTAAIVRSQEREVADREHDVGRERRRRRWSLVVVAVFAAALFALGAVQFRFAQDEQNSDNHRTCVSANASRAVSIGFIHVMGDGPADEQSERLAAWCKATAKPLVQGILAQHEIRHDLYDRMLDQAKQ